MSVEKTRKERESEQLETSREYIVSKSNELVRNGRYMLNRDEFNLLGYLISLIKPYEVVGGKEIYPSTPVLEYQFHIKDYADTMLKKIKGGSVREKVKRDLQGILNKNFFMPVDEKREESFRWLDKVKINKGSGKITVIFSQDTVPYLYDLKEKFSQYHLSAIRDFKKEYTGRLYDLIISYKYKGGFNIEFSKLKRLLGVDKDKSYKEYKVFNSKILKPSITEINEQCYENVTYETSGRPVDTIWFEIADKNEEDRSHILYEKTVKEYQFDTDNA